jgi:hypothetical protein
MTQAARDYAAGTPAVFRRRGTDYFHRQAVQLLVCETPGRLYRAQVRGSRLYEVTLEYADGGWDAECTCPVHLDCKHVVAAMLALQQAGTGEGAPPRGTLEVAVAEKLSRALSHPETALTRKLSEVFRRTGGRAMYLSELQSLFKTIPGPAWESLQLPAIPFGDEVAWWEVLAVTLQDRGAVLPSFLLAVVDEPAARRRISAAQRQLEVDEWNDFIRPWEDSLPATDRTGPPRVVAIRLKLTPDRLELEAREAPATDFQRLRTAALNTLAEDFNAGHAEIPTESLPVWLPLFHRWQVYRQFALSLHNPDTERLVGALLRQPATRALVVGADGALLPWSAAPLRWEVAEQVNEFGDYRLQLVDADGHPAPAAWQVFTGQPTLYLTERGIFPGPSPFTPPRTLVTEADGAIVVPAPVLATQAGVNLLQSLGVPLPATVREKIEHVRLTLTATVQLTRDMGTTEWATLRLQGCGGGHVETYTTDGWEVDEIPTGTGERLRVFDRAALAAAPALAQPGDWKWDNFNRQWRWRVTKHFAGKFAEWLARVPATVALELDRELDSLRAAPLRGQVRLECESAGVDWFDLRVVLDVADTKLTKAELKALLDARGGFVRVGREGWRRLEFDLAPEENERLARVGLNPLDFSSEPQRLHALQLADPATARFLPAAQVAAIQRSAAEVQTRVQPPVPAAMRATLRRYQVEGFHFLAYLSANRFGGVLADDMGLGKTLQTLTWLVWLREQEGATKPVLVVCPKSVTDNWRGEAERFAPGLRVTVWRGTNAAELPAAVAATDVLVLNYAQLRALAEALAQVEWLVAILDEGQYIKNPESQTAQAARALRAAHRLVLTGTPIENRLLDLWSLMGFAMPGVLGPRARFAKHFDKAGDPLARQRLAARVRPFLLRRTKAQVAPELPDRIEEDIVCEMEPAQRTLYRAELKRAQQQLLRIQTAKQFDAERFNFLTSLLRLRQICCHPGLLQEGVTGSASAKLDALMELLEPLMAEGHKVLVFSQFVSLIELLHPALQERGWQQFVLTGTTENRGALVAQFQQTEGAAVFLISLKAGGFGLNLTAASYVVLFDPWWNPAVENQAIDRTHRIGQMRTVNAYRLLIKDSIEEKIRRLQKSKSALAADVLGEERFAQSLTLDDLKFLLSE